MKSVIIHVGPPKTGTSAIQKWCLDNIQLLASHKICYPEHTLDRNGVSSGNLESICDIHRSNDKKKPVKVTVSEAKLKSMMNRFNGSSFDVLLLSSEFFIQHMSTLKQSIPCAKFVAYLRNPIEVIESNYNQGVKRSGFTHKIKLGNFKTFPHLNFIVDYLKANNDDSLVLHLYNSKSNSNFDIVQHFFKSLSIDIPSSVTKINNSYHLEALEYKRWVNQFDLSTFFMHRLDSILQGYDDGTREYSFVSPSDLGTIKANYSKKMKTLETEFDIDIFDSFIKSIESYTPASYHEQSISKGDFLKVCAYVDLKLGADSYPFHKELSRQVDELRDEYSRWFSRFHKIRASAKFLYFQKKVVSKLKR